MTFGKAILGDNQFLGVNHANQAKAAELYERFRQPDAVLEIIAVAYEAGVRDFMFTTHDRYVPVFDEIRRSNLFHGLHYSPCIPYAHKYWNRLSSQSAPMVLATTLLAMNPLRVTMAGLGLLAGQTSGMIRLLTEIEMLMCKGLPVRGVFLQNAAFDLLMALEAHAQIERFADVVTRRLGVLPGFITMNHPTAVKVLCDGVSIDRPWICANYNLAGFRTNPSQLEVEASFQSGRSRNIAMSVFSSGSAPGQDSLDYVISRLAGGGVESILFGSATPQNIRSNVKRILEG